MDHFILLIVILFLFIPAAQCLVNATKCQPPMLLCDVNNGIGGKCYPQQWKCDGYFDCDDKSDEPPTCDPICTANEFKCQSGRCLPRGFLCDGENDCGFLINGNEDFSDEASDICNHEFHCDINEYACSKGKECVHLSKFCDGNRDCSDGSDEHSLCHLDDQTKGEACSYGAAMTVNGLQCFCPNNKYYSIKTKNCEFHNFCERVKSGQSPVCTQRCTSSNNGSYTCSCFDPRLKLANESHCISKWNAPHPDIMLLSTNGLIILKDNNTDKYSNVPPALSKSEAFCLAYQLPNFENAAICYTDTSSSNDKSLLVCTSLESTPNVVTKSYWVETNLDVITTILYDAIGNNWIMSDGKSFMTICKHENDRIRKCHDFMNGEIGEIHDISYDPLSGIVFYSDVDLLHIGVWKVNISDGSRQRLTHNIISTSALAIDPFTRTVYFADETLENIRAVDYNAELPTRVVISYHKSKQTRKMIYAEGKLLVLTLNDRLFMYDSIGSMKQKPVEIHNPKISSTKSIITMAHFRKNEHAWKWKSVSVCQKAGCDDICIGDWNKTTRCICDDGVIDNGSKCSKASLEDTNILVVAQMRPSRILISGLDKNGKTRSLGVPTVKNVKKPTAVAVNTKDRKIYVYEEKTNALFETSLDDQTEKSSPIQGVLNCEGMAYDPTSDNLYMTDRGHKTVVVLRASNPSLRRVIASGNMTNPRGIVLHIPKSYVFWGSWSERDQDGIPPKIERAKLDGSQRKTLVSRTTIWINGLTIDTELDYLYWCDAYRNVIERIRINGADREIVVQKVDAVNHPYGLAFFMDYIYWTEFKTGKVMRYSTVGKDQNASIVMELNSTLFELAVFSTNKKTTLVSPCSNSKCKSDFCFASSCKGSVGCEPFKCECADGRKLSKDGTCEPDKNYVDPFACDNSTQFTCKINNKCIPKTRICDGDNDCDDGSDEDPNSTCKDFECTGHRHKCDGTTCLPLNWVCDGTKECDDGSDESEETCQKYPRKCGLHSFKCHDSTCVSLDKRCDGNIDCFDGSDERDCKIAKFCDPTEFRCGNGVCIEQWQVCDGNKNCADELDEAHCDENCIIGRQFRCNEGSSCLDLIFRCDGVADCPDGSDESHENCRNMTDYCSKSNQFMCADGKCIRRSHLCDGFADCLSGEDETECPAEMCDRSTSFTCRGGKKCIPIGLECDGVNDCGNNSDEEHCDTVRRDAFEMRCKWPMYECESSDGRNICIPDRLLCDGKKDCPEFDDEKFCEPCNKTMGCSHICRTTRLGSFCSCPENLYLDADEKTCVKKDPCEFGQCSQQCTASGSSKYCFCESGFQLAPDRFTCISDDPQKPFIIYTNRHEIRQIRENIPGSSPMLSKLMNAIALDYKYNRNGSISVYWTDLSADKIFRGLIEDRVIQYQTVLASYGVFNAEGISVDWVTGNVYWIDSSLDNLQVVSPDGSLRATVISDDMSNARSLAIDSSVGLMFWTDWQENRPRIERATLAGTDRKVIWNVTTFEQSESGWPNGITCDTIAKRIYWVDAKSDSIHTTLYDGSGHKRIIRDPDLLGHPFGIDVFQNYVYFSDWRTNTISRINKWNGSDFAIVERVAAQPFLLKIVHRAKQSRFLKNPCDDLKNCSGICLLDGENKAKCQCTNLQEEVDGKCVAMERVVLVVTSKMVRGYSTNPPHEHAFPLISGKNFDSIRNVVNIGNEIRILDERGLRVTMLNLTGTADSVHREEKALISGLGVSGVSGMTIDKTTGTTYLTVCNEQTGRIVAVNFDGTSQRVIASKNELVEIRKPRDIVFMEKTGSLYWFDDSTSPPSIYTSSGDGKRAMMVDINSTLTEKSYHPVVDQERQRIFWTSKGKVVGFEKGRLYEISIPGSSNITSVVVDQGDLLVSEFFLESNRTTVRRMKFETSKLDGPVKPTGTNFSIPVRNGEKYFLVMMDMKPMAYLETCKKCPLCLKGGSKPTCECSQGYWMQDQKCETYSKKLLYLSEDGRMHSVGWEDDAGTDQQLRVHSLHPDIANKRMVKMAVDAKKNVVYVVTSGNEVWMCSLNGSFAIHVFRMPTHRIAAIAVDQVTGSVVLSARVTMSSRGVIVLIDPLRYDEGIEAVLVEDEEKVPYEIAIDPPKGKIFWASAKCLKSANYDGSNTTCIVNKVISALAVDEEKSRICYIDIEKSGIDCVDYDGRAEQRSIVMMRPQGIGELVHFFFNGDDLYYFDKFNMSGLIVRAVRQADGTFVNTGSISKSTPRQKLRLFDMKIIDSKKSILYTSCSNNNGGCDHFCMTTATVENPEVQKKCYCVHSEMGEHGHCVPSKSFLVYTKFTSIEFLTPNSVSRTPPNRKITSTECYIAKIGPVAVDLLRRRLYFADFEKSRITGVNFDGTGCFVVAEDVGIVPSLTYDESHQDLYYVRANPAGIWRVSMAENDLEMYPTEPRIVLTLTVRDRPRHIAIHPCRMLIFFSNNALTGSVIEKVYFSGYKREVVIQEDLNDVRGLAIDLEAEKLYFSDAKDFRATRCDYDGSHREIVVSSSEIDTVHPFELMITDDELFFTDWIRRTIGSVDKLTGLQNKTYPMSSEVPVNLAYVDPEREFCTTNACTNNELNCEDYCRLLADGTPTCACNGERKLGSDNRTCSGSVGGRKCAENEFSCMASDICISYDETCDGYNDCPISDDEDIKYCSTRTCRPGYFSCGNGMCIPEAKLCNRVNDCFNFADESNCTCSESEFQCTSGMCIPKAGRCDFKQDCVDASDEKGCPFRNCSALEEQGLINLINCATTTQCILPSWKCDGTNDCYDGWDEKDCFVDFDVSGKTVSPPKECDKATQFACLATRTCMPKHWQCDGRADCIDGSDEKDCEKKCSARFEFTCPKSGSCIPIEQKCDGGKDCPDGEDEEGCENNECHDEGNSTFRCTNHRCIPMSWRCDGTDDCMDNANKMGSDELNCGGKTSFRIPSRCMNETCEVACELTAILCDGIVDCADGFDEQNCADLDRECPPDQWMCNSGQCIPAKGLCDASVDCMDGSDEWVDICSLSEPPKRGCPNGWSCVFRNGTIGCLEERQLCDGRRDCMSGIDELCSLPQGNCTTTRNSCDQPWNCQRRAGFEQCSCDDGYYLSAYDQTTCMKSPPCTRANCSHFCIDRRDIGHQCFCAPGYILDENLKDCRRNDTIPAEILLVVGHRLKLFSLSGHSKATLLSNLTNGVAVDYDVKTDLVYWTDVGPNENVAGVVSLSNQPKSFRFLKDLPTKGIDGIAVDWLGRNIYYTDRHQDAIAICDMRGRFHRILLKGNPLNDPRAIVLDPLKGLIFWTDWGTSAHIGRMNMDGTDIRVLLQDRTIRWPNALAVDAPAHRLYFGDAHRDYIGSCNYDGTKRRVVLRNVVRHIFALSVFEDFIYWSDWHNHTIERAHKITGERRKVLIHDKQYRPMGFKIVHPSLQSFGSVKSARHPCSQPGRCDNLCVPSNEEDNFTCMCAQGFRSEGRSCVSECKPLDMVCSGTYKCIRSWWRCDGQDDCGDGEDEGYFEPNICEPFPCEPGQFLCKNTNQNHNRTCLYSSKLCDGLKDCELGDDEDAKFCEHFECGEGYFKCWDNRKCVPIASVCDMRNDCADGSDEKDCEIKECDKGFFACVNETSAISKCIPNEFYCDGEVDCANGQDEPDSCAIGQCSLQQFRCANGKCIAKNRQCDGETDCRDGSDEKDCEISSKCPWQCEGKCMSIEDVCDGRVDCSDGGDEGEEACVRKIQLNDACPLPCADGTGCNAKRCDGIQDCADGSDEKGCEDEGCELKENDIRICDGKIHCHSGKDEFGCSVTGSELFQCSRNQTVERYKICDGVRDCADGKDEEMCGNRSLLVNNCGRKASCDNRKQCYDIVSGLCDGVKDCDDGSDENDIHCDKMCHGMFRCTNGRCIHQILRCDGYDDCGDASDENTCDTSCHHFGTCSQKCWLAWKNATRCHCARGYVREKTSAGGCVPISNFTELFVSNGRTIHWMTVPVSSASVKLNRYPDTELEFIPGSIDFFYESQKTRLMYTSGRSRDGRTDVKNISISDQSKNHKRNKRYLEQNFGRKYFDSDSNAHLVYDYIYQNIYFTENAADLNDGTVFKTQRTIFVSRLNDTNTRTMVVNSTGSISSIAIAPEENILFWSTTSPAPRIFSARLDGTPIKSVSTKELHGSLVQYNVFEPRSLVVDQPNSRLYWIDGFKRTVETVTFRGKDRRTVRKFNLNETPLTMDLLADDIYLVTRAGDIHRMHKFTGHSTVFQRRFTKNSISPLMSLKVANPAKVSATVVKIQTVPCRNNDACPADIVCVPSMNSENKLESKCLCGEGRYFEETTKKCQLLSDKNDEALQCGDYFCYNGAKCETLTKRCVCRAGFYGNQCEINQCSEQCWNGAQCAIQDAGNTYKIECKCPTNFTNLACDTHICEGVCGPRGTCRMMMCPRGSKLCESKTYCDCDQGWEGPECRHRKDYNPSSGHCFNGGKCSGNKIEQLKCECLEGYNGDRCENCDKTLECKNGGFCSQRLLPTGIPTGRFECMCPLGFNGTNCEKDLCENACPYGHKCSVNPMASNPIECSCQPNAASRNTDCEPICEKEKNWCRNGGECVDYPGLPGQCKCPPRFSGPRCDQTAKCSDYCLNNGQCIPTNETHYDCKCTNGYFGTRCEKYDSCEFGCENGGKCTANQQGAPICVCPKGLGGERCERIVATSCGSLECSNGGICSTTFVENNSPTCVCPPGWSGLVCRTNSCDNYCKNGGKCALNEDDEPVCWCKEGFTGKNCDLKKVPFMRGGTKTMPWWGKLLLFLSAIALSVLLVAAHSYAKSNRFAVFRQFRHAQMEEVDPPADQFSNPAYLIDEGGIELVTANTSLVNQRARTSFNNPVFEQEMMPIYNDTVENSELLPNN